MRRLPVGDGIWIARHQQLGREYVLDFIVERKNVDDLRSSIRDNRYREQKVRILVMFLTITYKWINFGYDFISSGSDWLKIKVVKKKTC